jgi:Putative peptidoglycan binding domain
MTYDGSPIEQARCLLRYVKVGGNVDDIPATLPTLLESLIGQPVNFTRKQLVDYLAAKEIDENDIGGLVANPLSQAPSGERATYFVIHDTSDELASDSFPTDINSPTWSPNHLNARLINRAHIFINRCGESKSEVSYDKKLSKPATKFEGTTSTGHGGSVRGLFLHHELIQPRIKGNQHYHAVGPDPGFTAATYERLALCYLAASVRKGEWMIPGFHCVIDLKQKNGKGKEDWHDDPQNFDLLAWNDAISSLLIAVKGVMPPNVEVLLTSDALKGEPILEAVAASHARLIASQTRNPGVARLQQAFNLLAKDHPNYAINLGLNGQYAGYFGSKTTTAVDAFQRGHGFAPNGEVGSSTILALDKDCLAIEARLPEDKSSHGDPHSDHGTPTGPSTIWQASAGYSHVKNNPTRGFSSTDGIRWSSQKYSDGTTVMTGVENLNAKRGNQTYPTIIARQSRTITGGRHEIQQSGYCHGKRILPNALFIENYSGLNGNDVLHGYSTRFGKSDDEDEGTGSELFGITQTSSEVCGCSVKASILKKWFGTNFATDPRLLSTSVEMYFPKTRRYARVPLTDVGPSESVRAIIDLTWAVDEFLGTDGGDTDCDVYFRPIIA